ncbi:MAG: hypothetical protein IKZ92_05750 [Muribaculaceae bacterium]|nr:hypothetical protein [Muribaculaceae bacterium]
MKKKVLLPILALLLAVPIEASGATLKGDVDGNGAVSINDVTALMIYMNN